MKVFFILVLGFLLLSGNAMAANITISDGWSTGTGWYGAQEDNEVEIGDLGTQAWDLEAFFLTGTTLTVVGGYDFMNGQADPNSQYPGHLPAYYSGDLFLATSSAPTFGTSALPETGGNAAVQNQNGYNYVLDLDWDTLTYDVYAIDEESLVTTVWFQQNFEGNPWQYESGGTPVASGEISYLTGLADDYFGEVLYGGSHNAFSVDLSFLDPGTEFWAHYTYQCGNDNLMGSGTTVVPEPHTMLLFGSGLIGLAGLGRRKFCRKLPS